MRDKPAKTTQRNPIAILLTAICLLAAACGGGVQDGDEETTQRNISEEQPAANEKNSESGVDTYLEKPPSTALIDIQFASYQPLQDLADNVSEGVSRGEATESIELGESAKYQCTETPVSLARQPRRIIATNPDTDVIWPGALVQGSPYLAVGALDELPIRDRAAITVSIKDTSYREAVENPTASNVEAAISVLLERAAKDGYKMPSGYYFEHTINHSQDQAKLDLGLSARLFGVQLSPKLKSDSSLEEKTYSVVFVQDAFTVAIESPQTPSGFFSASFDADDLELQRQLGRIAGDNPPMYVGSVTFGRVVAATFSTSKSQSEVETGLDLSFSENDKGEGSGGSTSVVDASSLEVFVTGGTSAIAREAIIGGEIEKVLDSSAPLSSFEPISFELRNVGDNSTAKIVETTDYVERSCTPVPDTTGATKTAELVRTEITRIEAPERWPNGRSNDCDGRAARDSNPELYGQIRINGDEVWRRNSGRPLDFNAWGSKYLDATQPGSIPLLASDLTGKDGWRILVPGDEISIAGELEKVGGNHPGGFRRTLSYPFSSKADGLVELTNKECLIRVHYKIEKAGDILSDPFGDRFIRWDSGRVDRI